MVFLLTILAVSVDAYLASIAYCLKRKLTFFETLYAGAFTFFTCILSLLMNQIFLSKISFINTFGAIIFIFLGIKNYLGSFNKREVFSENTIGNVCLLGIAVSIDASIACLTLDRGNIPIIVCALLMCVSHTAFLGLGVITARFSKIADNLSRLSGLFLIGLGIMRLL